MKRRRQNLTQKEWLAIRDAVDALDQIVTPVLRRGTHDSGIRKMPVSKNDDREARTPPPTWADPTGEYAIRDATGDAVVLAIEAFCDHIFKALNIAKTIIAITPANVLERAERNVPDCAACGDPINGKIHYARWDDKCYMRFRRWVDDGNQPDEKLRFEIIVQNERENVNPS